jgi:hypothetical protein
MGNRIFKFSLSRPEGTIDTLAGFWGGSNTNYGYADGIGTSARFYMSQYDAGDLAVTAKGDAVIVADTGNNCLRRIDLSTAATDTLAGVCGATGGSFDIRDGLRAGAKMYAPQRLIPVPHMSDERFLTERELMIVLPRTHPSIGSESEPEILRQLWAGLRTIRVVDVANGEVWSLASQFRDMISPILTGNVLVLADVHALKAIVVRDHCRQHASLVGSVCLCDPGWHDSPSVLDTSSLVWSTSSPRPYACVACTPGKFKPAAQGLCEPCPPGTSSGEASTTCQQEGQQPDQPPPTITGDFFVIFIVTMPYSRSEFDAGTQQKYKAAIASVTETSADHVEIINITESHRRASSVDVHTQILLADALKVRQMLERLGEGEGLLQQINVGLKKQDLRVSSAVSAPRAAGLGQPQVCIYV